MLSNRSIAPCRARLSQHEITRRIDKTRNVVRFFEQLSPFNAKTFNPAVLIWECIEEVPQEQRTRLLNVLRPRDIRRLWRISGQRYDAKKETRAGMTSYSALIDLPEEPHQVKLNKSRQVMSLQIVEFEGKFAAMGVFGWDRFRKMVFVDPESYAVCGRTVLHNMPLRDALYPLYFSVTPRQLRIPATGELCEMEMSFLSQEDSKHLHLPEKKWPLSKDPRFPFHGGLTEYLRPIGPGCYVGVGWREPRLAYQDMGRRFLTFMLIKKHLTGH